MYLVEAKRASQGDPDQSVTYNCSSFKDVNFVHKEWYEATYSNGETLMFKCTRARRTLYSFGIGRKTNIEFVPKGPEHKKVVHEIISIKLIPDSDGLKDKLFEQEFGRPVRTDGDVLDRFGIKP